MPKKKEIKIGRNEKKTSPSPHNRPKVLCTKGISMGRPCPKVSPYVSPMVSPVTACQPTRYFCCHEADTTRWRVLWGDHWGDLSARSPHRESLYHRAFPLYYGETVSHFSRERHIKKNGASIQPVRSLLSTRKEAPNDEQTAYLPPENSILTTRKQHTNNS